MKFSFQIFKDYTISYFKGFAQINMQFHWKWNVLSLIPRKNTFYDEKEQKNAKKYM